MLNTARIAKNTIFLYMRMILVLAANFLAVRVLLEVLGVDDYGLFNLIVGFVTLFTLLNGALMSTVQRFLCFELGRSQVDAASAASNQDQSSSTFHLSPLTFHPPRTCAVFTICFWLFAALSLLIFLASELLAPANLLPYSFSLLPWSLNIPPDRFRTAQIVYQFSILVMVAKTMQIPYTALIVSYERMNAFAKISIVEASLTLLAAFAIKWIPPLSSTSTSSLHLVSYSLLYALAQLLVCATYCLYCRAHFAEGHLISPRLALRTSHLLSSLTGFFSWSILGAIANMLKQQGLNVLLNLFFGVAFNATWAVANKIGMAVNQLVGNFQQAFNPQIIKLYAAEDKQPFYDLITSSSKFSYLLTWLFALPLIAGTEFLLGLWLKGDLPPQILIFVRLTVVYFLFDALSGPLWISVQATGKIAAYQIQVSLLISLAFFLSWIAFHFGAPAWAVVLVNAAVNGVVHFYRIIYLKCCVGLPAWNYCKRVMLPVVLITALGLFLAEFSSRWMGGFLQSVLVLALLATANLVMEATLGLSSSERHFVMQKVSTIVRRFK